MFADLDDGARPTIVHLEARPPMEDLGTRTWRRSVHLWALRQCGRRSLTLERFPLLGQCGYGRLLESPGAQSPHQATEKRTTEFSAASSNDGYLRVTANYKRANAIQVTSWCSSRFSEEVHDNYSGQRDLDYLKRGKSTAQKAPSMVSRTLHWFKWSCENCDAGQIFLSQSQRYKDI